MDFAQDLCITLGSVWNADLSVDMRDEYGLSERNMDGIRFDMSHDSINGRPRQRVLVTNPFDTSQKLNFPQPVKPRTAWRERMREREKAMELINYDEDKTCERNFDDSLDSLVLRDEALLRDGFSSKLLVSSYTWVKRERPYTATSTIYK
jgi:hypothetical protein